jgi:hypothetical protein
MGMGGLEASDASKPVLADAAPKQVDESSYRQSKHCGKTLDSRFRGNADYWRGVFNERQQETIA